MYMWEKQLVATFWQRFALRMPPVRFQFYSRLYFVTDLWNYIANPSALPKTPEVLDEKETAQGKWYKSFNSNLLLIFSCLELPEFQLPEIHEMLTAPLTLHRYTCRSGAGATWRRSEGAPMHRPSPGPSRTRRSTRTVCRTVMASLAGQEPLASGSLAKVQSGMDDLVDCPACGLVVKLEFYSGHICEL